MSLCPSCKHMAMSIIEDDNGVPIVTPITSKNCLELMKKHKEDVNDIFEEWNCPEFEQK